MIRRELPFSALHDVAVLFPGDLQDLGLLLRWPSIGPYRRRIPDSRQAGQPVTTGTANFGPKPHLDAGGVAMLHLGRSILRFTAIGNRRVQDFLLPTKSNHAGILHAAQVPTTESPKCFCGPRLAIWHC
jgi:hypothetical protein